MRFYIDPGTGSMLFAILIGIIGAVTYMLKSWILKLRFVLSGGKKVDTGARRSRWSFFRMTSGIGACSAPCAASSTKRASTRST